VTQAVVDPEAVQVLASSKYIASHHASFLSGKLEFSVEPHELGAIIHAKIGKRKYRVIYDEKGNKVSSVLVKAPVTHDATIKAEKDGIQDVFVVDKTTSPHRMRKLDPTGKRKFTGVPIYGNWDKTTHVTMLKAYVSHLGYTVVLESTVVTSAPQESEKK
jgi:hypothetical protein